MTADPDRYQALDSALNEGRMALAKAIGILEAHWEVCADPFPDASLRRALDRMEAASHFGRSAPACAGAERESTEGEHR